MFSKGNKQPPRQSSAAPAAHGAPQASAPSIISSNLRITGNLETDGDIQLDGVVEGDVHSRALTVGETGVINGSVFGDRVRIAGTVNGEICGKVIELLKSAKVTGDINHCSLAVEAGAFVQGLCRHVEDDAQADSNKFIESKRPNLILSQSNDDQDNTIGSGSKRATS